MRDCEPDSASSVTDNGNLADELEELPQLDSSSDSESDTAEADNAFPNAKISINSTSNNQMSDNRSIADANETASMDDNGALTGGSAGGQHRHLSARQRRDLKKKCGDGRVRGLSEAVAEEEDDCEAVEDALEDALEDGQKGEDDGTIADDCEAGNGAAHDDNDGPLTRRQRSKLKKMKSKYKDQDEEDRDLMMAILKVSFHDLFIVTFV